MPTRVAPPSVRSPSPSAASLAVALLFLGAPALAEVESAQLCSAPDGGPADCIPQVVPDAGVVPGPSGDGVREAFQDAGVSAPGGLFPTSPSALGDEGDGASDGGSTDSSGFAHDQRLVPVTPPANPPHPGFADDQRRVAIKPEPAEERWASYAIEMGFVFAGPLVGGTPLNTNATAADPTPAGVQAASGGAARFLVAPAAVSGLRAGLGLELVGRPLNAGAVSAIAMYCPEGTQFLDGAGAFCMPAEVRFNLPRRGVGPFSDGPVSGRLGLRGEYSFGTLVPQLGAGVTFERYARNGRAHLDALVLYLTAGIGLKI